MKDRIADLLHLDLRGRVMLATAIVLALGLALLTLGVMVYLRSQFLSDASSILKARAETEVAMVAGRGGRVVLPRLPGGEEESWIFVDGKALRRGAGSSAVQAEARALAGTDEPREVTLGDTMMLRAEPVYEEGIDAPIATVVAGIELQPYEHTGKIVFAAMVAFDAIILVIGVLLSRRAVGRALAPVEEMTRQASEWSERDLDQRFDRGPVRDELTNLAATLDRLLARIASGLRHEQRLSAEIAHELRTPLAGVRAEAELALRDPERSPGQDESLRRVIEGTERMEGVIQTLLRTARGRKAEGGSPSCLAVAAVREAVQSAQPGAAAAGIALRLREEEAGGEGRQLSIDADQALVVHALNPLLDNAVRHARREVRVAVGLSDREVHIVVADDGEGFVDASPASDSEAGAKAGSGLGLPLARRLARSAGGEVTIDRSPALGGRVLLRLPAAI